MVNLLQYFIGLQLISFTVIAPYISTSRWGDTFRVPNLVRPLSSVWYAVASPLLWATG